MGICVGRPGITPHHATTTKGFDAVVVSPTATTITAAGSGGSSNEKGQGGGSFRDVNRNSYNSSGDDIDRSNSSISISSNGTVRKLAVAQKGQITDMYTLGKQVRNKRG